MTDVECNPFPDSEFDKSERRKRLKHKLGDINNARQPAVEWVGEMCKVSIPPFASAGAGANALNRLTCIESQQGASHSRYQIPHSKTSDGYIRMRGR